MTTPVIWPGEVSGFANAVVDDEAKDAILSDMKTRLGVRQTCTHARCVKSRGAAGEAGSGRDERCRWLSARPKEVVAHWQTDGTPVLAVLTLVGGRAASVLVERRTSPRFRYPRMFVVPLFFSESAFSGTVLAGELVHNGDAGWELLVDDALAAHGRCTSGLNLEARLREARSVVGEARALPLDPVRVRMKQFLTVSHALEVVREEAVGPLQGGVVTHARHRGLVLRSTGCVQRDTFLPYRVADTAVVKFLEATAKTDVYNVFGSDSGESSDGTALVPGMKASESLRSAFANRAFGFRLAHPCVWSEEFRKWRPVCS